MIEQHEFANKVKVNAGAQEGSKGKQFLHKLYNSYSFHLALPFQLIYIIK